MGRCLFKGAGCCSQTQVALLRWGLHPSHLSSVPGAVPCKALEAWETAGWVITARVSASHSQQQLSTVFMASAYKPRATPGTPWAVDGGEEWPSRGTRGPCGDWLSHTHPRGSLCSGHVAGLSLLLEASGSEDRGEWRGRGDDEAGKPRLPSPSLWGRDAPVTEVESHAGEQDAPLQTSHRPPEDKP